MTVTLYQPNKIKNLRALHDQIIVCDMSFDIKTSLGGVILLSGDGKLEGIHPRWAKVYAVGPDQKDVKVGQYVLIEHGRWTRGFEIVEEESDNEYTLRRIDNNAILLVSDEPQIDETLGKGL